MAALLLGFGRLHAQDVVLREPYIERAPAYSEWMEANQPNKAAQPTVVAPTSPSPRAVKEMTVSKADGTRREVSLWMDGQRSERWFYKDLVLFQQPGRPDVYIINSFQLQNMSFKGGLDISQSDFPKLAWVSKEAFKGVESSNKKSCYYFEKKIAKPGFVPKLGAKPGDAVETVTLQAWIDAETKLPVSSDDGVSITTYTFREIPQIPLELPPQFAKAIEAYK